MTSPGRKQSEARRIAKDAYPFKCCVVCGATLAATLDLAHLDQNAANNDPDNLAWLCKTHHWMCDAGLYPIDAIKMLRAHWQVTRGKPDHSGRMKDAGVKAAQTRKWRAAGKKAAETRRRRSKAKLD